MGQRRDLVDRRLPGPAGQDRQAVAAGGQRRNSLLLRRPQRGEAENIPGDLADPAPGSLRCCPSTPRVPAASMPTATDHGPVMDPAATRRPSACNRGSRGFYTATTGQYSGHHWAFRTASTGTSSLTWATPCSWAALATWSATTLDVVRRAAFVGSRAAPGADTSRLVGHGPGRGQDHLVGYLRRPADDGPQAEPGVEGRVVGLPDLEGDPVLLDVVEG